MLFFCSHPPWASGPHPKPAFTLGSLRTLGLACTSGRFSRGISWSLLSHISVFPQASPSFPIRLFAWSVPSAVTCPPAPPPTPLSPLGAHLCVGSVGGRPAGCRLDAGTAMALPHALSDRKLPGSWDAVRSPGRLAPRPPLCAGGAGESLRGFSKMNEKHLK